MNLTSKIGPLPAWGWGAILGGLAAIYIWIERSHSTDTTTTDTDSTDTTDATDQLSGVYQSAGIGNTVEPASDDTTDTTDTTTTTNSWWETQGVAYASSQGNSPLTAQTALEKYLTGQTITTAQSTIVNAVIAKIGLPPEGTSGIPAVTATATAAKPDLETSIAVTKVLYNANGSADVTTHVRPTHPSGSNTLIDSGAVSLTYAGKTIATSGVHGGTAILYVPVGKMPKKGVTQRYLANFKTSSPNSWAASSTETTITGKK